MLTVVKTLVPFILYAAVLLMSFAALTGRTKGAFWLLVMLIPLRNVLDKLHMFPMGDDIVDILLLTLLIGTVMLGVVKKERLFVKSPINLIIIIMILYMFISVFVGSDYLNNYIMFDISDPRVQTWKNFCILPLLFVIALNTIKDKKAVWITVAVMCFTIIFMDMYVVRQISWYSNILSRLKIHGTFVYLGANEVAAFYNMYTVILISLYFPMKKGIPKKVVLGIIIINTFCILFMFSRAAYIAYFIGLFFLFAVKNKKLLIVLIFIAVYWQIALPAKVQDRILMTTDAYGDLDRSSANRLMIWDESMRLFLESPITGVGYGVFSQLGFGLGDTHNIYLKIMVEQGLFGIIIFLLLLFVLFIQGIKLFIGGDDDYSRSLGLGFAICIIVLLINNMFGDRWTYIEVCGYFWIFAGLVIRLNILTSEARSKKVKVKRNTL